MLRKKGKFMTNLSTQIQLDGYQILKSIGSGATGCVYLAKQTNLDRLVAIKVIHKSQGSNSELVERGLAEARILAKLHHPNIVAIHDVGEKEEYFYMIIEYVDHGSLEDKVFKSKKMNELEVWKLTKQVCSGLQAALVEGIIHRDIKPANILLSGARYAKIGDFGISKIVDSTTSITKEGMILGTPSFISPETAQRGINNFKSDIYSLGVSVYFCLTKRVVFEESNVMQLLFKHVNEIVDAPGIYNDSLTPESQWIIAKMLHKNPKDRYHSYSDLLIDIDNLLHKKKPVYATMRDAQSVYKREQTRLFSAKSKRISITRRLMKMTYNPNILTDHVILMGMWDSETRQKYILGQPMHFMRSTSELSCFLGTHMHKQNAVVVDVDFMKEATLEIVAFLKERYPQTYALLVSEEELALDEKCCCLYTQLVSRLSNVKHLTYIKQFDLTKVVALAKERLWSFELEIHEDETINRIKVTDGNLHNNQTTQDIDLQNLMVKRNTTWRIVKSLPTT